MTDIVIVAEKDDVNEMVKAFCEFRNKVKKEVEKENERKPQAARAEVVPEKLSKMA